MNLLPGIYFQEIPLEMRFDYLYLTKPKRGWANLCLIMPKDLFQHPTPKTASRTANMNKNSGSKKSSVL